MIKKMLKKLRRAWKWYIKGDYHCDKCPYCWSDWNYLEGDGDCGCYIRGDLWDTCRLIPPIRFLIGWPRKKVTQYWEGHAYDGMGEWYEQLVERENAYAESIKILLKETELYQRDCDGKLMPICKADLLEIFSFGSGPFGEAFRYYEDHAHPVVGDPPLKKQWKDLLRKTWNKFADHFRPYFS